MYFIALLLQFLVFVVASNEDLPTCKENEQFIVFGNCSEGTRKQYFFPKPDSSCKPEKPKDVDCKCQKEDFVPKYGECEGEKRGKEYIKISDCEGDAPMTETVLCECTPETIISTYGECRGTRDIFFFYPDYCDSSTLPPLEPRTGEKCDFSCPAGQYYNVLNKSCKSCPPGKESKGDSVVYSEWSTMPSDFHTRVTGEGTPWKASGFWVETGIQRGDSASTLFLEVDIVAKEGSVTFAFECFGIPQVPSQLSFTVDDEEVTDGELKANTWANFSCPLTFGHHKLCWIYNSYDEFGFDSLYLSNDGARIKTIIITGANYLVTQCVPCKAGWYSKDGECRRCERDTYSDQEGSTTCTKCPEGTYSPPGATECRKRPACQKEDFYSVYLPCNEQRDDTGKIVMKQRRHFEWVQPKICDEELPLSKKLPEDIEVDCGECNGGMYRPEGKTKCEPCPTGTFKPEPELSGRMADEEEELDSEGISGRSHKQTASKGYAHSHSNADKCLPCPAGHRAPKTVILQNIDKEQFEKYFTTTCISDRGEKSDCASDGWRTRMRGLDSGNFHSGPVQVVLKLRTNVSVSGRIEFDYTPHLDPNQGSIFKFFSGTNPPTVVDASEEQNVTQRVDLTLIEPDDDEFTFVFIRGMGASKKDGKGNTAAAITSSSSSSSSLDRSNGAQNIDVWQRVSDYVSINRIVLHSVKHAEGGAMRCDACPPGSAAASGDERCEYCPLGTYALNATSEKCLPCPEGTFASHRGQLECMACGKNTLPVKQTNGTVGKRENGQRSRVEKWAELAKLTEAEKGIRRYPMVKEEKPSKKYEPVAEGATSCLLEKCGLTVPEKNYTFDFSKLGSEKEMFEVQLESPQKERAKGNAFPKAKFAHSHGISQSSFSSSISSHFQNIHPTTSQSSSSSSKNTSSSNFRFQTFPSFYMNLCNLKPSENFCRTITNSYKLSLACEQVNNHTVFNWGSKVGLEYIEAAEHKGRSLFGLGRKRSLGSSEAHVLVSFYDGDKCKEKVMVEGKALMRDTRRSATLKLTCVPGLNTTKPAEVAPPKDESDSASPCRKEFEWRTDFACRLCREEDYEYKYSECHKMKQKRTMHLKDGALCSGGFVPPTEPVELPCRSSVVMLTAGQTVLVVVSVLVAACLCGVLLVWLYCRNRKLSYQLLQNDSTKLDAHPTSMMDEGDEEGVGKSVEKDEAAGSSSGRAQSSSQSSNELIDISGGVALE
ncbi:uncharacterized protein MONOS_1500 [Monocercomonoides exilis]|uniref:uncharacterized protein n=1 Tax=Monocercomonoides exilis TaxID=2049356 RepID=UPI003559FD7E|nr:hypothetical protein MONOS_1500 [Monocercomonoides exilis]|eukprot:MONOS_1500.1-p1 / transcript=MONOS_1500.1 / gene=MONOS_1500 / organism=Monocercomonoides_exilis_PA203 / gene_product=UPF0577 protein KIAA1324-like homolog precursor / transcript_product=UPF0577 protein KIAA1324-like homolog precursor / location=Mono_scaffold00026:184555-188366(-) / protein_length=1220 / sequence_SO=supercontig / SO=protein_coding / is_pseudo=false